MFNTDNIKVIRSARKTLAVQVLSDATVVVRAPFRTSERMIHRFIADNDLWIQKQREKYKNLPKVQKKSYLNGATMLFLGKEYSLQIGAYGAIALEDSRFLFPSFLSFRIEKELLSWYMQQAKDIVTKRLDYHATQMQVSYSGILFSDTKSKWGTCGADNALQFNWRLVMAPINVLDYVVIHELSHITEKNHSAKFWRRVGRFTPAYRQHRKWLNANGHLLII